MLFIQSSTMHCVVGTKLLQQLRHPSLKTTYMHRNNNVARPQFVGGLYAFKQQQSDDIRRFPSIVSACAATLFAATTTYNYNNNSAICAPALSSLTIKNSRSTTNNTTTNNIIETSNKRTKYTTNDIKMMLRLELGRGRLNCRGREDKKRGRRNTVNGVIRLK